MPAWRNSSAAGVRRNGPATQGNSASATNTQRQNTTRKAEPWSMEKRVPTNPELQVTTNAASSANNGTAAGAVRRTAIGAEAALQASPRGMARWGIDGFLMTLTLRPGHNQINQNIFAASFKKSKS
ncbi:hypothetical protein MyNCGM683_04440 [Achromobacter xylosoxidans]